MIDRTLCNAFIAFNKITEAKMKSLDFRRRVAQSLITRGCPPKVGQPVPYAPPVFQVYKNLESEIPDGTY